MWAKRFPVPEFERHSLKNLQWTTPVIESGPNHDEHCGVAVNASPQLYEKFKFRSDDFTAIACTLPNVPITVSGNSFAWPIQRVVIVDSLEADSCQVIADWTTPRPMNTRLGPDGGVTVNATEVYVLCGHKVADHWIPNRIMLDNAWTGSLDNGYRVLSSSETEINDFHDAVIYFEWQ